MTAEQDFMRQMRLLRFVKVTPICTRDSDPEPVGVEFVVTEMSGDESGLYRLALRRSRPEEMQMRL